VQTWTLINDIFVRHTLSSFLQELNIDEQVFPHKN